MGQVWASVIPVGPSGGALNSSFRTRDTPEYKTELGLTLVNVARIVPDGLLVFFPSYTVLNGCVEAWRTLGAPSTIWRVSSDAAAPACAVETFGASLMPFPIFRQGPAVAPEASHR
jgi:regulator of telomere elongation helicase 1